MKKIQLLLMLFTVLLMVAGAGCSKAKKSYFLDRANRWFDSGQFDKAEIEYLNVIQVDPQNVQAVGRLGVIYFDEGRFQKAAPFLYKGSELDTNNMDLHMKLAQIYLAIGMLKEAHSESGFVLDRNPQDPDAPVLFAESVVKQNDIEAVQQRLHALAQNGDDAAVETALGMIASNQHDLKTALTDYHHAIAFDSHFAPAYVALGNSFWEQNDLKSAKAAFKAAADFAPPYSPLQLAYGKFEIQSGDFASAEGFFDDLTAKTPNYVPAWLGLAEVALNEKKLDDCSTALNKALAVDADNLDAQVLQARLDMARSDINKATSELERLVKMYPQASHVHYQLALAYVLENQPNKALNQSHEALDLDSHSIEAAFLLAQLELKTGDTDSAIDLLKQFVRNQPDLIQAKLLLAEAYRVQNNFNGALEIYQQLEQAFPKNPQIPLLAGATFIQQLNETAARQEFNRALAITPGNLDAQEELAQLDLADHQYATAQKRVEQIVTKNPQQAFPQILLAKIFLSKGETNQAITALSKASTLPEGSSADLLLAQLYSNSKQDQKALETLNVVLGNNPKDVGALMLVGLIQSDLKNYRAAADAYEKLLGIDPQYSPALNNLAWLYSDNLGDVNKAYDLAQHARQLLPADPATADTLGWVLFQKRQYPSALKLFQESANQLSDNAEVQFHVGIAHYMLMDEDAARSAFQRALNLNKEYSERSQCEDCLEILNIDPKTADAAAVGRLESQFSARPSDPIAFTKLAAIYQRDNNTAKAMALCETALKANPQNVNADLLLAQLCASSNPQRAFELAKAAYQLKPDDMQVCATLGRMAFLNGNDHWAYNLLAQASQNQPDNAQTLFDFANTAFCIGKISDAQTAMQSSLQDGLSISQSADAKNFLDLIAVCQNPEQAASAEPHVDSILSSSPNNAAALLAKAVIDTQNRNSFGAESGYEKLLSLHRDCTVAQKNLAILYAQNLVDPDKAYPVAVKAREAFPDDPQVAKALALILFQRGDYVRAADLFNTISDSTTADAELFYCLGISEFRLKNYTDSRKSLQHALTLNLSGQQATDARQTLAELNN
ncbi:MAG TPA: tetratricopeptide repeat protein [Verrucomicrobiae bacterium]|jgi:tetratricopeptide (TPR) repeat protein